MKLGDYIKSLVVLSLFIFESSCGYKILGVFPHAGKSHFMVFLPILRELTRRGHEVTVISHFPETHPLPNYTDISIVGAGQIGFNNIPTSMVVNSKIRNIIDNYWLAQIGAQNCEALNFPQIQNLITSNKTFDLIINEHFNTDCFMALNYILKTPNIGIGSCTMMPWLYDRFGIPNNPSYMPVNLLHYGDEMTFFERVINTVGYFLHSYIMANIFLTRPADNAVRKYLGENIPSVVDIVKNTSLFLINTHYTLNRARPYPPNVIEISGVHLDKPKGLPPVRFINFSIYQMTFFY